MSLPPSYNLLEKYPNRYFIESGSFRGDAIQLALDAGFEDIRSMDIDVEQVAFCQLRFDCSKNKYPQIRLYCGNSALQFKEMFRDIRVPITFWLDAHSQLFEDEIPLGNPFPLLEELKQIKLWAPPSCTILIDDTLVLTHPDVTGWSRKTIEDAILAINPAYKFEYIGNPIRENLLIATV